MRTLRYSMAAMLASCGAAYAQPQTTFTWIGGTPSNGWLRASAVTNGGTVVAGSGIFANTTSVATDHAFRWTPASGIVNLGVSSPSVVLPFSYGVAMSADGSIVVGESFISPASSGQGNRRAVKWVNGGAITDLGGPFGYFMAAAISADGATVYGMSESLSGATRVAVWTSATPTVYAVSPLRPNVTVTGCSGNGASAVGYAYTSRDVDEVPFLLEGQTWTNIGTLPGDTQARAVAMSEDGRVIVGISRVGMLVNSRMFRWVRDFGMEEIQAPAGVNSLLPTGTSGDGSVIVGTRRVLTDTGANGFVWARELGAVDTGTLLESYGVNLTGYANVSATAISSDGKTLAGTARDAAGFKAWVATFPVGFGCYANCDGSSAAPLLTALDFQCFLNRFAAADVRANCDGSTAVPVLNSSDFQCFLNKFAIGCT